MFTVAPRFFCTRNALNPFCSSRESLVAGQGVEGHPGVGLQTFKIITLGQHSQSNEPGPLVFGNFAVTYLSVGARDAYCSWSEPRRNVTYSCCKPLNTQRLSVVTGCGFRKF